MRLVEDVLILLKELPNGVHYLLAYNSDRLYLVHFIQTTELDATNLPLLVQGSGHHRVIHPTQVFL